MNSSLIGKFEKAHRYAAEPQRVRFQAFRVTFNGDNDVHEVALEDGRWRCSCGFFAEAGLCPHTMAMEKLLAPMLPEEAATQVLTPER